MKNALRKPHRNTHATVMRVRRRDFGNLVKKSTTWMVKRVKNATVSQAPTTGPLSDKH